MDVYERREFRKTLEQNSYRIANEIEYAVLKFVADSETDTYPSKHYNEILNHLEEVAQLLIPSYESIDISRATTQSLGQRGLLGNSQDVHFDNLPNETTSGWRIPSRDVLEMIESWGNKD